MDHTREVDEAAKDLSSLLTEVESGTEIVITRAGRPIARLIRIGHEQEDRKLGFDRGAFRVPDDFDAPLPAGTLEDFETS